MRNHKLKRRRNIMGKSVNRIQTTECDEKAVPLIQGTRIVSKAEYVRLQAKLARKTMWAALLITIGVGQAVGSVLYAVLFYLESRYAVSLYWLIVGGTVSLYWLKRGFANLYRIEKVDAVVLTRANIAELPASDSLVRASKEPAYGQGTALLRAATEPANEHGEQLLRAASGEQK